MVVTDEGSVGEYRGLAIYQRGARFWAYPRDDISPLHAPALRQLRRLINRYFDAVPAMTPPTRLCRVRGPRRFMAGG